MSGIKHEGYSSLMTSIKTQIPPFSYVEVQSKLLLHSNAIETTSKAEIPNPRTVANLKINGYTMDEKMRISNDKWAKLTQEQRDAFKEKRKQLITKRSLPSNQNGGKDGTDKEKEKINQHNKLSKYKINKLKQTKKQYDALIKALNTTEDKESDDRTLATPVISNVSTTDSKLDVSKCNSNVKAMIKRLISQNSNVRTIHYRQSYRNEENHTHYTVTVDSGADTCLDGSGHIVLEYTERRANVKGFDNDVEVNNLCIGTSVTAVDLSSGESIILLKNETIDHTSQLNSMLSVNQFRCNNIDIDDVLSMFVVAGRKGSQQMVVGTDDNSDCVCVPFEYKNNFTTYNCRTPTNDELLNLPIYVLTSDALWDPTSINSSNYQLVTNNCLPTLTGQNINEYNLTANGIVSK